MLMLFSKLFSVFVELMKIPLDFNEHSWLEKNKALHDKNNKLNLYNV